MIRKLVDIVPPYYSAAEAIYEEKPEEQVSSTLSNWLRETTQDINRFVTVEGERLFPKNGDEEVKAILSRELQRMDWLEEGLLEIRERQCQNK